MKRIFLLLVVVFSYAANAQSTSLVYRSKQTGFSSDPATWEVKSGNSFVNATRAPFSTDDSIIIRSGHTVSVGVRDEWDQVLVETGATLRITQLLVVADGPGNDLVVNGTLLMESPSGLIAAATSSIRLNGNLTAIGSGISISAKIDVAGTAAQTLNLASTLTGAVFNITGPAVTINLTGFTSIDQLTLNSSGTVNVVGPFQFLLRILTLNTGRLIMDSNGYLNIQAPTTGAVIGGNSTSFVEGPLRRNTGQPGVQTLFFPVGKGGLYRPVSLDVAAPAGGYSSYQAEIVNTAPNNRTLPATLSAVSNARYAKIINTGVQAPTSAVVTLAYGTEDAVTNASALRIAKDDGAGNWVDVGGTGTANGAGSITSAVNFSYFNIFVLGTAKLAAVPGCTTNTNPANGAIYGSTTSAIFLWNAAANATLYDLYLWTGPTAPATPTFSNIPQPSFGANNLTAGTLYSWYVVPKNASGAATGCISNKTTFTTGSNASLPCITNTAPANGSTLVTQTTARLRWTASAGALSYYVYLAAGNAVPTTQVSLTSDLTYYATNLAPGTLYSWYIVPRDGIGGENTSCGPTSKTTFTTATATGGGNIAPVANAGSAISITLPVSSVLLDGTGSYDADGQISQYYWSQAQGPVTASVINSAFAAQPSFGGLTAAGTYVFGLQVKDNNGIPAYSQVTVTVNPAGAAVPTCTTNTNPPNGSGTSGSPTAAILLWNTVATATSYDVYLWTGATPPATPTYTNITGTAKGADNLVAATLYNWYVVPKNASGPATGCIANKTTFTTAPNSVLPCFTNTSPANGSTLVTQTTARLRWAPGSPEASSSYLYLAAGNGVPAVRFAFVGSSTTYYATNLTPGTLYSWYIGPRDEIGGENTTCGATSKTTFTTAAATGGGNIAPVANAGNAISITLPVSSVLLDGTGSYDADGQISQYYWFQAQGPATASVINSAFAAQSSFGGLTAAGNYVFVLQVKDNNGIAAYSQVTVTVKPAGSSSKEMNVANVKAPALSTAALPAISCSVSPNPVSPGRPVQLQITSDKAAALIINLLSSNGKLVGKQRLLVTAGTTTSTLRLSPFAQGLYMINISGAARPVNIKLLVE